MTRLDSPRLRVARALPHLSLDLCKDLQAVLNHVTALERELSEKDYQLALVREESSQITRLRQTIEQMSLEAQTASKENRKLRSQVKAAGGRVEEDGLIQRVGSLLEKRDALRSEIWGLQKRLWAMRRDGIYSEYLDEDLV